MSAHGPKRRKLDHSLHNLDIDKEVESQYESSLSSSDSELDTKFENGSTKGVTSQNVAQLPKLSRSWSKPMPTKDMYTSDMFQIQLGELLAEVRPNYEKVTKRVEKTLRRLKQVIDYIPARDPQPVCLDSRIICSTLICYIDLRGGGVFSERYWGRYCLA